jgi:hypothetical protein
MNFSLIHEEHVPLVGEGERVMGGDKGATLKDSPRKRSYPDLPVELHQMVYQAVFTDCILKINDTGDYFVYNRGFWKFTKNMEKLSTCVWRVRRRLHSPFDNLPHRRPDTPPYMACSTTPVQDIYLQVKCLQQFSLELQR